MTHRYSWEERKTIHVRGVRADFYRQMRTEAVRQGADMGQLIGVLWHQYSQLSERERLDAWIARVARNAAEVEEVEPGRTARVVLEMAQHSAVAGVERLLSSDSRGRGLGPV